MEHLHTTETDHSQERLKTLNEQKEETQRNLSDLQSLILEDNIQLGYLHKLAENPDAPLTVDELDYYVDRERFGWSFDGDVTELARKYHKDPLFKHLFVSGIANVMGYAYDLAESGKVAGDGVEQKIREKLKEHNAFMEKVRKGEIFSFMWEDCANNKPY